MKTKKIESNVNIQYLIQTSMILQRQKEVFVLRIISYMIDKTLLDNNQQYSFLNSCSKIIEKRIILSNCNSS